MSSKEPLVKTVKKLKAGAYADRLYAFVKNATEGNPHTKAEFEEKLKNFGNPVERRAGGQQWKEFQKDAITFARAEGILVRKHE